MKFKTMFSTTGLRCLGAFALVASMAACTDLEIEETDSIIQEDAGFQGVTDPGSFLDNQYNSLNGYIGDQANLFALSEVTTDAALIPTRGSDWGDNGIWRQLHQHNWQTDHAFITNVFNQWNTLHFQSAQILSDLTGATTAQRADAYFLRALGMFVVLDNFGQIPVRDPEAPLFDDPIVLRGEEAVNQIVADLNAAIADLPGDGAGSGGLNRATKSAARYLLAKVLLNKHVYLGTSPDSGDMSQVVSLVDQIEDNGYELEEGYFDIFRNDLDNETIWWIPTSVGNRIFNGLHYNQGIAEGGGWNGFATLAEYYDLFEGDPFTNEGDDDNDGDDDDDDSDDDNSNQEERRGYVPRSGLTVDQFPNALDNNNDGFADGTNIGFGFLIGQQYALDGSPLNDRAGNPLTFKREFLDGQGNVSLINNDETTGIRVQKYGFRYGPFESHEIFFRYSDAYLMKAEAMFRNGEDVTEMINELRIIRDASPLGSVSAQDILDERGRELYAEFWRRNDMIRFGQFTRDWELKEPSKVGDESRNLFPIPASQVILNPNLEQNPGY